MRAERMREIYMQAYRENCKQERKKEIKNSRK